MHGMPMQEFAVCLGGQHAASIDIPRVQLQLPPYVLTGQGNGALVSAPRDFISSVCTTPCLCDPWDTKPSGLCFVRLLCSMRYQVKLLHDTELVCALKCESFHKWLTHH